ncbi:MAG: hypothetical protein FWH36_02645 [Lentimicrobiaceae bacterium]|nr:hypothetical protein [Lentimicrobiaceae bacterium]
MKKIKISLTALAILAAASCETPYRMVTTLERNGKVQREVYAFENGAFMKRNTLEKPFLFELTPDWKFTRFDTAIEYNFFGEEKYAIAKVGKNAKSIEQYSKEIQCDKDKQSYAAPEESLVKKFRWFYTRYSFKTVYKKLQYELPVSIDDYLSKKEQILWTQGDMSNYKVQNGLEMYQDLDKINDKFSEWMSRNYFETSFESIRKMAIGYELDTAKETIYEKIRETDEKSLDSPETICTVLDSFYQTTYFSQLYESNKETLKTDKEDEYPFLEHIFNTISYELVIPGQLTKTNAPLIQSDTLIWKVDGMRLLFDDYVLSAEYRVANIWAFIVSGVVILIAVGSLGFLFFSTRRISPRPKG